MEIVYYFKDYPIPMYQWQHVHIIDELKFHDCNVHIINPLDYTSLNEANERLLNYIKENEIDLFMTPHNEEDLFIETLEEIKKTGVPTLLICFDNLIVPFMHYKIAPHFDLVWLTSKETKPLFDRLGVTSVFLPYAANPRLPRGIETINGVGFVGNPYGSRANMINSLTENGIEVYCHCIKPKEDNKHEYSSKPQSTMNMMRVGYELLKFHQGRKVLEGAIVNYFKKDKQIYENSMIHMLEVVPPSDLYKIYPKYSLALSSTAARNTGVLKNTLQIVNLRSFEIPMSGGLQMCQYTDEISEYFENDKEIILYRTQEEMIDKAKFFCSSKQEETRKKMREAARKKAETNHTWFLRFSKVFDYLGLDY